MYKYTKEKENKIEMRKRIGISFMTVIEYTIMDTFFAFTLTYFHTFITIINN